MAEKEERGRHKALRQAGGGQCPDGGGRKEGEREDLEATVSFLGWEETMGHTLHALARSIATT